MAQLHDDALDGFAHDRRVKTLQCACGRVLSAETGEGLLAAVEAHLEDVVTREHDCRPSGTPEGREECGVTGESQLQLRARS
jgi:hypothetical protein